MESIEKLRDKIRLDVNNPWSDLKGDLLEMVDEIEREIAERFMKLPTDADDIPIKVGETVYGKYLKGNPEYTVRGFMFDQDYGQWNVQVGDAMLVSQNLLSHVKPRTLEDVLSDFAARVLNSGHQWGLDAQEATAECAAEIRGLMETE